MKPYDPPVKKATQEEIKHVYRAKDKAGRHNAVLKANAARFKTLKAKGLLSKVQLTGDKPACTPLGEAALAQILAKRDLIDFPKEDPEVSPGQISEPNLHINII